MKNTLLFFSFFISSINPLYSQNWYQYDRQYLKVSVNENGIYKISKNELLKSSFKISDPEKLQMFYRGKEIPIYLSNSNFNQDTDYILFYGMKNDGELDRELYRPQTAKIHNYYSLYSDKTYYFLTNGNSNGKRLKNEVLNHSDIEANYSVKLYKEAMKVWQESSTFSTITGWAPDLMQSYFEPGEFLSSKIYNCNKYEGSVKVKNDELNENFQLSNLDVNGNIELEVLSTGRWQNAARTINVFVNDSLLGNRKNTNYELYNLTATIPSKKITNNILNLKINANTLTSNFPFDAFTISYFKYRYPVNAIHEGYYRIEKNLNSSVIEYDYLGNGNPIVLNITNNLNPSLTFSENLNNGKIRIHFSSSKDSLYYISENFLNPIKLETLTFVKNDSSNNSNYFILTEKKLEESSKKYKEYRESAEGGSNNVELVFVNDLYNKFTFGERNPIAIKNWIKNLNLNSDSEKELFIIGNSYSLTDNLKKNEDRDFVPTIGFPASDYLLTEINGVSNLTVGRINAITNDEVYGYLDKVIEFEKNRNTNWSKNFLYLGGGKTFGEFNSISQLFNSLSKISAEGNIGSNAKLYYKKNLENSVEDIDISNEINNGVGLLTFCGHSTIQVTDLNFGFVSDSKNNYANKGKYPFMFFNGCGAGNIFSDNRKTLSKDWILTPNKGAIAILAHSQLSYLYSNAIFMEEFHNQWFKQSPLNQKIGNIVLKTRKEVLSKFKDLYNLANVHQMVLQGDPAIRIFNMTKPDFATGDEQLYLTGAQKDKPVASGATFNLNVVAANYGIYEAGSKVNVRIKKTYTDGKSIESTQAINAIAYQDTLTVSLPKESNLKYISVDLDSDTKIDEMDEANNSGVITLNWEALATTSYYSTATLPDRVNPNLNVTLNGQMLRDTNNVIKGNSLQINLLDDSALGNKSDKLDIQYRKICDNCSEDFLKISPTNLSGGINEIQTSISLESLAPGKYEFYVQGFDARKNPSGQVLSFVLNVQENITENKLNVYPNPANLYTTFELNAKEAGKYNLLLFNIFGYKLLHQEGNLNLGLNKIYWNGTDNSGQIIAPGAYIYKFNILQANKTDVKTGRLVFRP